MNNNCQNSTLTSNKNGTHKKIFVPKKCPNIQKTLYLVSKKRKKYLYFV